MRLGRASATDVVYLGLVYSFGAQKKAKGAGFEYEQ